MRREFKFRLFNYHDSSMVYFTFNDLYNGKLDNNRFFPWEAVKKESIMQYTGLKDKNGKEIYEGDIDSMGYIVKYEHGAFLLVSQNNVSYEYLSDHVDAIRIVDNIYENLKLLEKVKITNITVPAGCPWSCYERHINKFPGCNNDCEIRSPWTHKCPKCGMDINHKGLCKRCKVKYYASK